MGERVKMAASKEEHAAPIRANNHKIRVLLADDHIIVRQAITGRLAAEPDIEVVAQAVSSGEMAMELARRVLPDIVVMDINMPGIGGIEATRCIKKELPQVKIIGLSMHCEPETIQAMLDAGADAYLSKSASIEDLLATIHTLESHEPAA